MNLNTAVLKIPQCRARRLLLPWLALILLAGFTQQLAAASETFNVDIDTLGLIGDQAGPFYLDVQFTDGSGAGDGNNTISLSHFSLGSGAIGAPVLNNFSGSFSFSSQLSATDNSFFSEAYQEFNPGGAIAFTLTTTTNVDAGGTPDEISIGILDKTLSDIPTLDPGDALFVLDLNSNSPTPQVFASNTTISPAGGGPPLNIPAPMFALQANSVPEPNTLLLTGAALVLLGLARHRIRKTKIVLALALALFSFRAHAQTALSADDEAILANPVNNRVYIANEFAGTVTVFDGVTYATVATINVGGNAFAHSDFGNLPVNLMMAVNPATNKVYVINAGLSMLTVIDGVTNNTATVNTGPTPSALAINPVTDTIYVGYNAGVTVIDGAANSASNIAVPQGVLGMAINPATNQLLITARPPANSSAGGELLIVNGATKASQTLLLPNLPFAVAVNQVTNQIYTANVTASTVSVINGTSLSISSINVGSQPAAIAINSAANKIYVANSGEGTVSIINGATNTASKVTVGATPTGFAVSPYTNQIYVANQQGNAISIIDGTKDSVTGSIGTGAISLSINPVTNHLYAITPSTVALAFDLNSPTTHAITNQAGALSVAINPVTNKVYASDFGNVVSVYNGATETPLTSVTIGTQPSQVYLASNPVTNKIYAANQQQNLVGVIDGTTDTETATIPVGTTPIAIAVDPQLNEVFVLNQGSATVSVIRAANNSTVAVPVGQSPVDMDLNVATGNVYVANQGSRSVTVVNANTLQISTVPISDFLSRVIVDPIRNKIYAIGASVTVIDGATLQTTSINLTGGGIIASAAFNAVLNQLYILRPTGELDRLDGASLTVTYGTSASEDSPALLGIDPVNGKLYSLDTGTGGAAEYDPAALSFNLLNAAPTAQGFSFPSSIAANPISHHVFLASPGALTAVDQVQTDPTPLQTTISPFPNNTASSPASSFTFSATSQFPSAPKALYYQVDSWIGDWIPAAPTGNGTFSAPAPPLVPGGHVLYAYAADGEETSSVDGGNLLSIPAYGPLLGTISAYGVSVPPPPPAANVTSSVTIVRGGLRLNRADSLFTQVVTVTNSGATPLAAPFSLVLDNLSANATFVGTDGITTAVAPIGSPYINASLGAATALNPGESVSITLQFSDPTEAGITYTTRVLAGAGSR